MKTIIAITLLVAGMAGAVVGTAAPGRPRDVQPGDDSPATLGLPGLRPGPARADMVPPGAGAGAGRAVVSPGRLAAGPLHALPGRIVARLAAGPGQPQPGGRAVDARLPGLPPPHLAAVAKAPLAPAGAGRGIPGAAYFLRQYRRGPAAPGPGLPGGCPGGVFGGHGYPARLPKLAVATAIAGLNPQKDT